MVVFLSAGSALSRELLCVSSKKMSIAPLSVKEEKHTA